jgi:glucuronate isomerase
MPETIFNEDFLLQNEPARRLYHQYARKLPIIDYHNHLPPEEIASNRNFSNLTEIWLKGDHYKWRAMRALGVDENLITGKAGNHDKFKAWAACVPKTLRNPLFHWSHLELKRVFEVDQYLNPKNADEIYRHCNNLLQTPEFSTRGILKKFKVELVGTTDDPCDSLEHHRELAHSESAIKVAPTFRPDRALQINRPVAFIAWLQQLEKSTGKSIHTLEDFLEALEARVNFFHAHGCRCADHGLPKMPVPAKFTQAMKVEFNAFLQAGGEKAFSDPDAFAGALLLELCRMYHARGWVQQFHLGSIRNNNSRLIASIGADAGADSIGDYPQANTLALFLDALDRENQLPKTILYNLNPADNEVFAAMCGNFQGDDIPGKIQFGSGWWFLDQKDGMEKQINALSNLGILSTFIGMTTDSRSFLSFPRHEYFRRVLCNLLGQDVEQGLLPTDETWLGELVEDICYHNARRYFRGMFEAENAVSAFVSEHPDTF